jgi:hypothetical protein
VTTRSPTSTEIHQLKELEGQTSPEELSHHIDQAADAAK